MQLLYPNLVKLGGINLTDESRGALSESRDERQVEIELASGKLRRYTKVIAHTWSIDWENVGLNVAKTIDGKGGRDDIKNVCNTSGALTLELQDGVHATQTFTVFIDSYSEDVIMRRGHDSRYKITVVLKEQG